MDDEDETTFDVSAVKQNALVNNVTIINSYKESYNFLDLTLILESFPNTIKTLVENTNLNNKEHVNEE